ncbi:MAG TPA: outer membrane protein assembly factor BamA [Bryobacteraceae bacterium]|nr:outer membrane protein assembly factor BamA [Bryobacteraceae bacterium]
MVTAAALPWMAACAVCRLRGLMILRLLLAALISAPLYAQSNSFEGRPIVSIRMDPEEVLLAQPELEEALAALKVGSPLRMADVRATIERLYASGRYDNILVDADASGDGVALVLRTTGARFIRNVVVDGVPEPPSRGLLVNATKLELGGNFSESQTRQSVESLLEVLRSNGFYMAKVTPEIQPAPVQQVDIRFLTETGNRAKFSTPVIKGTPNKPLDEIIAATRWRKMFGLLGWKEVTDTRTQQGIDRIRRAYQKREFLMARVTLDSMEYHPAENAVVPVIAIDSGPKVVVRTKGAKISRGRLRELVPIYQEQTVDRDLLVEGKRELTEYLQARGYFDAQVDFDMSKTPQQEELIEYSLYPGERHKLVSVEVEGNRYFDDGTLRERMYTMPASLLRFRHGRFSQDYLRRDTNAIRALYQSNGFRDVEVTHRVEDDFKGKENQVAVTLTVKEGPQWFVSDLRIEGLDSVTTEDIRALVQSSEGQPFSDLNVATDQDTILNYFFNNGYPNATFEATVTPAAAPQQMSLLYKVTPGERQFVRDVLISGFRTTDEDLIRERIRNLNPGDPLSQSSMIESQRRLYDLGIFARVDTALQNADGETDHKYVLYRLEEARRYSVTGGFGAQIARIGRGNPSITTPAATAGFSPRVSFGISRSNFLGVGHTLGFQGRLSAVQRRSLVSYLAPQFKGYDNLNLTYTALYDDSRDIQTFNSRKFEMSIQLAHRLTKANTVQYRLTYRRATVSDLKITPDLIPLFAQNIQLGSVSSTFIQDRRDDPTDPRRGVYNTLDGAFASNLFGSKTSFTRVLGRNATYHRLTRDVILARSLSLGVINRISTVDVPLPERFFGGGATSHRGFNENQAGPRDLLTGFPLGGKALLVNNTEVRFPLIGDDIGGVLFHDAGNVYSNLRSMSFRFKQRDLEDFNYMVHAVGFGIRYRTPVGPIRLDLAYSINSPQFVGLKGTYEELLDPNLAGVDIVKQRISRFQFHFSLGQLF